MDVLVVGSVAYDSVKTRAGERIDVLGGSATFFGISASRFAPTSLLAVVGDDFRAEDRDLLASQGLDLSGLETAGGQTFRWGGEYHPDMKGRDTLFTELNVFEAFDPRLSEAHREASVVFLANIHPALQNSVLESVKCPHFVALDTMNFWIDSARDDLIRVIERVDALLLNDEEAHQLTGESNALAAARTLMSWGPSIVVIKRGEHGALVLHGDDRFYVPGFPLDEVIDPTGAGDTFAGGFIGHLARTEDFTPANVRRAAVVGSLMASYCVEGFSVERLATVTDADIQHRYQDFLGLTQFDALSS
jgi:sugar/nucleoside kinase (ribokinase family)